MSDLPTNIHQDWSLSDSFRTKSLMLSVMTICDLIDNNRMDMRPDFKMHNDWPHSWESKLIESILIGFPLSTIFCEENSQGDLIVLDGSQIISSLYSYRNGGFRLKGLTLRKDLNGLNIRELSYRDYNLIMDRFLLNISVISYDTNNLLKYEFCKRINLKNTRFSVQSARNYAYSTMFENLQSLRDLTKNFLVFDILSTSRKRDDFKNSSDIDQFFLYLCTIAFWLHNMLSPESGNDSVVECLDIAAQAFDDKWQTKGVDFYIADKIEKIAEVSNDREIRIISPRHEDHYTFIRERDFYSLRDGEYTMEQFINLFYKVIKNEFDPQRELNIIFDDNINYFDTRRSFKSLFPR